MENLAARFTVVSYDRREFSKSQVDGPQDYAHRLETDADDIRLLIQYLGADPGVVFGCWVMIDASSDGANGTAQCEQRSIAGSQASPIFYSISPPTIWSVSQSACRIVCSLCATLEAVCNTRTYKHQRQNQLRTSNRQIPEFLCRRP